MQRKYPIGIQSFREVREGGFVYIDKTEIMHQLVESGKYYFLSRPRRFGKSLLLDTIEELFKGSKELFRGLWIYNHWNWQTSVPVLHFNFASLPYKEVGLEESIRRALKKQALANDVTLASDNIKELFEELIDKVAQKKGQVVILIDEYDKPLIDFLHNTDQLEANRSVIKSFYSILKGKDQQIRFLLLTGVSRFSKISLFSDINNLRDITISNPFAAIAGITQDELERDFAIEIKQLQATNPDILAEIKKWYNGYTWNLHVKVYNPFSLLNYMADPVFRNYWFATGTPTFLINLVKARGDFDFDSVWATENILGEFNTDHLLSVQLLFQTGYLTLKSYNTTTRLYELGYPNQEVKDSLLDNLLSAYRGLYPRSSAQETGNLLLAVTAGNVPKIVEALNSIIKGIPYDYWKSDTESIFTIITVLTFRKIGVDVQAEVHSAQGRCDVLIKTSQYIYVMELKLNAAASEALQQILNKGYMEPYLSDPRKKLAIGINFSSEKREADDYIVKEM